MRLALVGVMLLLVACADPNRASPGTVAPVAVSTSSSPTPRIPVPANYEMVACSSTPPVSFAVLCEAFDDVVRYHVDGPEPAALAAAAALGVATAEIGTDEAAQLVDFGCVTPHDSFDSVCQAIARRSMEGPVDLGLLVTAAVQGMFRYGLDPFSSYVSGAEMEAGFDPTGMVLELGMVVSARDGTGSACGPIAGGCWLEVLSVFEPGASFNGGISAGDRILSVDGTAVEGLSAAEATAALAGVPGTTVVLELNRSGVPLQRSVSRVDLRLLPSEIDFIDRDIVYMRMNDFSQQAAVDLGSFLQLPEVEGASGMVLDLRDNPGGLVLAAQGVASQFLDGGLVLVERGRDHTAEVPVVEGGLATSGLDLVVLVNRASASAAEIVAAVLQERGRATVVGEATFGKNLVQIYQRSRDGGQVGITIARWETPGGLDIGITGLEPDVVVSSDPSTGRDEILEAGLALLGH